MRLNRAWEEWRQPWSHAMSNSRSQRAYRCWRSEPRWASCENYTVKYGYCCYPCHSSAAANHSTEHLVIDYYCDCDCRSQPYMCAMSVCCPSPMLTISQMLRDAYRSCECTLYCLLRLGIPGHHKERSIPFRLWYAGFPDIV